MTCQLCRGLGIVYGTPLTGTVCPACGGTGTAPTTASPPAEKTLLDEFAIAAMAAIISKTEMEVAPSYLFKEKIRQTADGAYCYATAMMRERARRDEMGNVKEAE